MGWVRAKQTKHTSLARCSKAIAGFSWLILKSLKYIFCSARLLSVAHQTFQQWSPSCATYLNQKTEGMNHDEPMKSEQKPLQSHRCYHSRSCHPTVHDWLTNLLPGILLATIGLSLFAFVETEDNYKYIHSAWHVAISLSISFLLPRNNPNRASQCKGACTLAAPTATTATTMQSLYDHLQPVLNNDSELVDIADYRLDSDLTSLIRGLRT